MTAANAIPIVTRMARAARLRCSLAGLRSVSGEGIDLARAATAARRMIVLAPLAPTNNHLLTVEQLIRLVPEVMR
jgi:hypothetical protein